jgi:trehalose 6-phosphate phosphatase
MDHFRAARVLSIMFAITSAGWGQPLDRRDSCLVRDMAPPPEIERGWALFLDLDGTLIDLAPTPDDVVVPDGLCGDLGRLRNLLGGALAIVSGRPLAGIDRLLPALVPAGGAEHGAIVRRQDGTIDEVPASARPPADWIATLRRRTKTWHGVLVEEKRHTVAVHFRLAPARAVEVEELVTAQVRLEPGRFERLAARDACEIRPRGITKARAVNLLMGAPPFEGRTPIYVGDDTTDEDGMAAVRHLGGIALHVGSDFGGDPAAVRWWIGRAARSLA